MASQNLPSRNPYWGVLSKAAEPDMWGEFHSPQPWLLHHILHVETLLCTYFHSSTFLPGNLRWGNFTSSLVMNNSWATIHLTCGGVSTQIRYGKNQSEIIYLSRKPSWILGFQTWDISKNAPHRLCMNVYVYECMHMSICLCIYVHNIVLNGQWWQNGHHRTGGTIF